ncbi:hypothetical protein LSCM1_01613 [Leishmania martiniquensis]|uniref:Serine/threonine-protein phosphatase 4 regulatory subunit 3-like central domain-containing protein n=1 Tax=Leishmania martiniquensis TaxID=1580590 RepID=A0A836H6X4_9TRYP|nr:hypothetical protein LSCM1_01613 [Leishmania martiniquensis]
MERAVSAAKAKLFAAHETGEWIQIGIGIVSVIQEHLPISLADDSIGAAGVSAGGGGKRGKATDEEAGTRVAARLQIYSIDSPDDLLLSSFVSLEDVYTIQSETILLWHDDAVSNEIACCFDSKDDCDLIYHQITSYQQAERLRRVQNERVPVLADKFLVHPHNLAGIVDAVQSQNKRFGLYVREDPKYFTKLVQLFHASREKHDAASMESIARIVLALLQSPYNTEGKIMAQLVENERIDDCIDIVQYGLGRRDKESGFVSFEERRATFHNPCNLSEGMLQRIHVLYSCGFLRDLIPLHLEPADAPSLSLLSTYTVRFTANLLTEIVLSPSTLPDAFRTTVEGVRLASPAADPASIDPSKLAHLFELTAFVADLTKTVKSAMASIDARAEIFSSLVRVGVLPFLTTVLECALRYYDSALVHSSVQQWAVKPPRAVQLVCDTLYSCASHFPECVEDLVAEANAVPDRCLLQLLLRAITLVRSSAEAQSVVDAVQCCGVGIPLTLAMFGDNAQLEARRHEVLRFWIEGNTVDRPPLFYLATHLVQLLDQAARVTAAGPLMAGSNGVCPPGTGGALQLSLVQECQIVYGLRIVAILISKVDSSRGSRLLEVLTLSKLMPALATTLVSPQRRMANLQSSVISFLAAVLDRRDACLVALATEGPTPSLLHMALLLYLQCSHRDNVLSASLAHLVTAVCDGVHREKLQGTSSVISGGSLAPSPFVTILRGDDSISKTDQSSPTSALPVRPFEAVASALLLQFGERLATKVPVLYERLQKAVTETPEQAQLAEVETSSLASSVERSAMPNFAEFDAAAIDFGLESPLGTLIVHSDAEARLHDLIHSAASTSDEDDGSDDDPLASLSSIDDDADEEGDKSEPPSVQASTSLPSGAADSPPGAADQSSGGVAGVLSPASPTPLGASTLAALECADPPSGRGSLLEDEENRLPRRSSIKRGRSDPEKLNDDEEEDAEAKRVRAEESAA